MNDPNIAVLWDSEVEWSRERPFEKDDFNDSYHYFSESARKVGGEVFIAKYSWWSSEGLEKGFIFRGGEWRKVKNIEIDVVFDKYRFDEETVKLKRRLDDQLPVLNPFELEKLCKDKLLTYERFPEHVAKTYEADESAVEAVLEQGKAVLKPRYDFGGKGVSIIEEMEEYEKSEGLLVQEFIDSAEGIPPLGIEGVHDLRVVVIDGEPVVSYVREPESGLVSNVQLGGSMKNVELDDVPEEALDIVSEVDEKLQEFDHRLYSVDFIFDEVGKPWILELNSKPGLGYYGDEEIAAWKKPLIDRVVNKLVDMGS